MRTIVAKLGFKPLLLALAVCSLSAQTGLTPVYAASTDMDTPSPSHEAAGVPTSETGEYIVKLREGSAKQTTKLRSMTKGAVYTEQTDQHMLIRLDGRTDAEVLNSLAADPQVEYIEPNMRMYATSTIDDTYYSEQWGLGQIQAPEAWEEVTGDAQVTVAVIDTGVDYSHPDLKGRVNTANDYDYVNKDKDAKDDEGHGTHVAGIIAAQLNAQGIAGVAGNSSVKILPLKVLDAEGEGDLYDVASAIMDAADLGADVINLSLGAELGDNQKKAPQTLVDAITYAMKKGALVVAAAGNESSNADRFVPASIAGVVTVSAIDSDRTLADFSNYGSSVDIAAPGVDIISTYPGGRYVHASGTSQATPFVSGVAALLKTKEPDLTVKELTDRLLATATDLGKTGRDSLYGYGLVNAYRAVQADSSDSELPEEPASVKSVKADRSKLSLSPNHTGTITLTATMTDGTKAAVDAKDVEWKTNNTKIAVVENGVVTATGIGKTSITAAYQGKTVTIPVEIVLTKLAASKTSLTMKPDGEATVQLTATFGDKNQTVLSPDEVEWTTQDKDIAVVQDGLITAKNIGSTYIVASYAGKSVKIRVSVSMTKLVASKSKLLLKPDESASVEITAFYGEDQEAVTSEVEWKTADARVAVYKDGEIVAKGFGSTTITASYRGKSVRISIDTRLKQLQADETRLSLQVNQTVTPVLKATYSDGSSEQIEDGISWTSSNEKVAAVEKSGEITTKAKGTATITAQYGGKSVRISLTVKE